MTYLPELLIIIIIYLLAVMNLETGLKITFTSRD